MQKVIETKSILAKLLATEDITVEHQQIGTAAFDVKNRKLLLPMWGEMSDSLYDLLIGHEVGHARYTPPQGWHDAVLEDMNKKAFYNILEDVRIEKKVKKKYPGLVKSFYQGYRELFEKDFFGVKDRDYNNLTFIDRINLHYKIGAFLNVQFSDTEKEILARLDAAETWDDIKALAEELYQKAQDDKDTAMETMSLDDMEFGEDGEDLEPGDMIEWLEGEGDVDAQQRVHKDDFEEDENPIYSETDATFRRKEEELLDKLAQPIKYVDFKPYDYKKKVISPKDIYNGKLEDRFQQWNYAEREPGTTNLEEKSKELYSEFMRHISPQINAMAAHFDRKKAAQAFRKASISKTGDLNEDKLFAYKLTEDLFKRSTSIPDGKNHGFLMYLDMSGSMDSHMAGTIDQLLTLVLFCQKVNIPFEVYGFTTSYGWRWGDRTDHSVKDINFASTEEDIKVVNLYSSTFKKAQRTKALQTLLLWKECFRKYDWNEDADQFSIKRGYEYEDDYTENPFEMGGTPLNTMLALGVDLANDFRKAHKVEILNTIVLTDGGATDWIEEADTYTDSEGNKKTQWHGIRDYNHRICIRRKGHQITSRRDVTRSTLTTLLSEQYKQLTGSKLINFYVTNWNKRQLDSEWYWSHDNSNSLEGKWEFDKQWDKQKSSRTGVLHYSPTQGFDEMFWIKGAKNLDITEQELQPKSAKKIDVLREFKKLNKNKTKNKIFLNNFIEIISKSA
jgi:hypothetical protein